MTISNKLVTDLIKKKEKKKATVITDESGLIKKNLENNFYKI